MAALFISDIYLQLSPQAFTNLTGKNIPDFICNTNYRKQIGLYPPHLLPNYFGEEKIEFRIRLSDFGAMPR